jgi:hypothetical protein
MPDRLCRHCQAPLSRKPGERLSVFSRRVCCSRACAQAVGGRNCRPQLGGVGNGELDESRFAMTHTEIAARLGMSRQRVYSIEKRALEKLRAIVPVGWRAEP